MARTLVTAATAFFLVVLVFLTNLNPILGLMGVALSAGLLALLALGIEKAGVASVVLAMFLAPWDGVRPPISIITFSDVFLVIGILLLVPTMIHRHARLPIGYTIGAYILLVSGLLASALGPDPATSAIVMARLVVAAILLPVFFAWWHPPLRTVDWLAWGYVLGQVMSSLAAFVLGPEANNRYKGLSSHVNYFGHSAVLAIALCMYLFHRIDRQHRWILFPFAALFAVSIAQSGSRAAVIVGVLLLVIYPLLERNAFTASSVLLVGAVAAPIADWALGHVGEESPLSRLIGDRTTDHSDAERTRHLQEALDRYLAKPILGDGFSDAPLLAHNIYLQVLVVVGTIGFVGFLLIFWSIMQPLFDTTHPLRRLGYAVFAYATIGMLTNSLWDRFIWIVLATAFLGNLRYDEESPPADEPEPTPRKTAAFLPIRI